MSLSRFVDRASSPPGPRRARRRRHLILALAVLTVAATVFGAGTAQAAPMPAAASSARPDLGPNVKIFDPTMPVSEIQATVDAIAAQQIGNQFGSQRYALLFKPGTYGTAQEPLNFQVGYYTEVAGLGLSPSDVVINGSVYVRNQCDASGSCVALNNFWRSLQNLTINVTNPGFGCYTGEFWPVSQAAPMRRVHVIGLTTLMDYCTGPSFASGGFIADSQLDTVVNGSQQQWLMRNSSVGSWTNGVWNQVFSGVQGAPAQCFPAASSCGGPYTVVATSPVTREAPFLYVDSGGRWKVFVPEPRRDSSGVSWASGAPAGRSIPLKDFVVVRPDDDLGRLNDELARGQEPALHPRHLPRGQDPHHQASRQRRARTRLPDARTDARQRHHERGRRARRRHLRSDLRRRGAELARAAPGRAEERAQGRRSRPDGAAGRVLPDRRRRSGQGDRQPRGQHGPHDPGRHLGVAGGPRQRRRVDGQHRRHRRRRQRRRRHGLRPVRRALPEGRGALERQRRDGHLLPERDAVRPAEPGRVA